MSQASRTWEAFFAEVVRYDITLPPEVGMLLDRYQSEGRSPPVVEWTVETPDGWSATSGQYGGSLVPPTDVPARSYRNRGSATAALNRQRSLARAGGGYGAYRVGVDATTRTRVAGDLRVYSSQTSRSSRVSRSSSRRGQ